MAARVSSSIDLFAWPAVRAAQDRVEAAEQARQEALRRHRCAPHGEVQSRLKALQEASHEALKAELDLARAEQEAIH